MNANKQKGTKAETAIVRYLRANGHPDAERRALAGVADRADIAGVPGVVIESKDCGRFELAKWLDEATKERDNAGVPIGVVWAKRRGRSSPADWYVIMDGATFVELIR